MSLPTIKTGYINKTPTQQRTTPISSIFTKQVSDFKTIVKRHKNGAHVDLNDIQIENISASDYSLEDQECKFTDELKDFIP